jgi:hypothetical protein
MGKGGSANGAVPSGNTAVHNVLTKDGQKATDEYATNCFHPAALSQEGGVSPALKLVQDR